MHYLVIKMIKAKPKRREKAPVFKEENLSAKTSPRILELLVLKFIITLKHC